MQLMLFNIMKCDWWHMVAFVALHRPDTKLAVLDHVSSAYAICLPVKVCVCMYDICLLRSRVIGGVTDFSTYLVEVLN